ncbi:MAG: hypothetical protein FWH33_00655 [Oscillospiraceae bacterium]|nr:hypothetical protein [Oscillospiraceae bacterium]
MVQGDTFTIKRVFTKADVEKFIEISGDRNQHHITPDANDRVVVHGLLTATLPSIVGGQMSVNGREFHVEWFKPVYTDEEIECTITIDKLEHQPTKTKITASFEIFNQYNDRVAGGHFFGLIAV